MAEALLVLVLSAALGAGAVLTARTTMATNAARDRQTFRLTFPRGVEAAQITAALRSVQGLLPRFPDRLVVTRSVGFETVATAAGIAHYLTAPTGKSDLIVGQIRAAIPGLRVVPAIAPDRYTYLARELVAVGVGSLRTDISAESNAAILASIQPLGANEAVIVQWSLSPSELLPAWLLRLGDRSEEPQSGHQPVEPQLRAVCRVGVRSLHPDALLSRVFGAIHRADAPERRLTRRLLPSWWAASRLDRGTAPVLSRSGLGADELAAVIGFPIGGPQLPGLGFAGSRTLSPAPDVPTRGRVLGDAISTGQAVAIGEAESKTGLLVTSPTGAGKSTVLEHLCAADFAAARGVVVIESKGDLVHRLANLIPAERLGDVAIFDPADPRPAGFNLLAGGEEAADLIAEHVVGQFRALYAGYLGPRSEMLLRAALLTLSQAPGSWAITEVMALLSDAAFRRQLMGTVEDHQLAATWAWFDAQSDAARAEMIGPLANKLAAFTLRRKLRAVVGQSESALDFDAALRERKIVLVSLRKALIGEDAARLLGSCILAELWAAIQRRAALDPSERPFVSVVLDEAQDFLRLPVALGDAVAQSRGLGVGWTVAHQNLAQLQPDLRAAVLANLRSKIVMQTTADDARAFAREFAPHLDAADFQGLGPFEAYAAVSTGAAVAPPASIRTRPPLASTGSGRRVRAAARKRYGRDPKAVDAEIQARLSHAAPEAPVGARRRR
jgi:Type IV secretion-system coupling protein DNA-binding domain